MQRRLPMKVFRLIPRDGRGVGPLRGRQLDARLEQRIESVGGRDSGLLGGIFRHRPHEEEVVPPEPPVGCSLFVVSQWIVRLLTSCAHFLPLVDSGLHRQFQIIGTIVHWRGNGLASG